MNNDKLNNIRVLLVDDDEDDYLILKRTFRNIPNSPFKLSWSNSFDEARELVKSSDYDVFLIDYRLGAHTGLELLELAMPNKRSEPFLILTGASDTIIEQESIRLAAADYLVKGSLNPTNLSRALYYALGRKQIEAQRLEHYIELNKTKDEFISLASHQLRTPVTGVKQYLGMVLEGMAGEVPAPQKAFLEKAYESNERQLAIVSDLLRVAQIDSGTVELRRRDIDLVELMRDVAKEQTDAYKSRQQKLNVTANTDRVLASIDPVKIRMVFDNLVDNAGKYSNSGSEVNIELSAKDNWARVDIIDQGVGIATEDMDKLFEKFSRIHNSLSTQVGGTGLGLYWAKHVIDLHGGMLRVTSVPGEGSTFSVFLPQAVDQDDDS